jgi:hypothetical protein
MIEGALKCVVYAPPVQADAPIPGVPGVYGSAIPDT